MAYKWSRGRVDTGDLVSSDDVDRDTKIDFEEDQIKLVANNTEYLAIGTGSTNVEVSGVVGFNGGVQILENGRVGIGTVAPDYKLDVAGNIGINEYIYHNGDANTFIRLQDDSINFQAGSVDFITITEASTDEVVINESSADMDFRVESNNAENMFFVDGTNNRIGIGTNQPVHTIDIQERTGVEAVIRLIGTTDVGIRLAADSDNSGENDNPYIDFYQDGQNSNSRPQRLASLAMEGDAGTTFTGSLANAIFLHGGNPATYGQSNLRILQLANDSQNNGNAARITLEGSNGYVGIHTNAPTTEMEVIGTTKSDFFATDVTTQDLGSGTSATLSTASGIVLLDAGSINGSDMGGGMEVFSLAFPTPTISGQKLTIIAQNADTNNVFVLPSGLVSGSFSSLHDSSGIHAITFVQIVEGSHKAWYQIGKGV